MQWILTFIILFLLGRFLIRWIAPVLIWMLLFH